MQLLLMPLFDFINHAHLPNEKLPKDEPTANVVALPYHDSVNNESYVILQALRDIKKDD